MSLWSSTRISKSSVKKRGSWEKIIGSKKSENSSIKLSQHYIDRRNQQIMHICSQSSENSKYTQSDEYSRCLMKIEYTLYLRKIEMIAMVPSSTLQNTAVIFCESRDKWTRTRTNVATVEHGVQNLRRVKSLCLHVQDEIPRCWVELSANWWLAWCISTPSQTFISSSVFIKRYTQEIKLSG